ncbi:Hypothetical predicted protein [Xyrichtys novacula]|uniref:Uncharacterized protein n=1 Tax=Xyrichtys novacula TaxID=13765 RepID=A0AAV1HD51_XYRNO|nr:Hypothetical predicted protein [Xyrichtys novacula]
MVTNVNGPRPNGRHGHEDSMVSNMWPFPEKKVPVGFPWFRNVPGPRLLRLTGPPSGPGSCQDEENTLRRHTVTGADVVVRVRQSFHFTRRAIDSPAG